MDHYSKSDRSLWKQIERDRRWIVVAYAASAAISVSVIGLILWLILR